MVPDLKTEIEKLEEDLKLVENELKIANNKPFVLPEYNPINKSNLLTSCANEDAPVKKYEKKSAKKRKTPAKKHDEEEEERLVDEGALKRWTVMISGKDPKFQKFAAKAMWARDVTPLFANDLKSDPARAMEVVGTLAAFIEAFGDCDESKLAEAKIDEIINIIQA